MATERQLSSLEKAWAVRREKARERRIEKARLMGVARPRRGPGSGRPPGRPRRARWEPTELQRRLLRLCLAEPELARASKGVQAREVRCCVDTIKGWWRVPEFRSWWNRELVASARDYMGPALFELIAIIGNVKVDELVKVKAIQAFLEEMEKKVEPKEASTAVLLEAFGPKSRAAIAMRDGASGKQLAAILEGEAERASAVEIGKGLEEGARVGAVELGPQPETGARIAIKIAQSAEEEAERLRVEDDRARARERGELLRGEFSVDASVPRVLGNLASREEES